MQINKLDNFKNKSLTQVVFIHDYLQLVFQECSISVYSSVEVIKDNKILKQEELGFCDELISIIDNVVKKVELKEGFLKIIFENNFEIKISLKEVDYNGPEAMNIFIDDQIIVE